eukprot:TRINITY_DN4539_c1_g1_i2.p1 TRINITY_DN4539_c1_g1~~TRINITY_DN4539_c1_g1_i2.p1  ORF type:complete len:179 (+),score=34.88 TRINITY_DN4539_c1_g1_i2:144-680(+)
MALKFSPMVALLLVLSMAAGHQALGQLGRGGPDGDGIYKISGSGGFLTRSTGNIIRTTSKGSNWILEQQPDGSYKIQANSLGALQVLAPLEPVFKGGAAEPDNGPVQLNLAATVTWDVSPDALDRGWLITAANIPADVVFPEGFKVYLVSQYGKVFWKASGGPIGEVPLGSMWTFRKL